MVVELLAWPPRRAPQAAGREHALVAEARVGGRRLALAFPQTFMNDSGLAVAPLVRRYGITDLADLVDRPRRARPARSGRAAGQGGRGPGRPQRSALDQGPPAHDDAFTRIRIGIGKPPGGKEQGVDHVLRAPSKRDRTELDVSIELAADAVELHPGRGCCCRPEPVQWLTCL